jgi:hypothetical protein
MSSREYVIGSDGPEIARFDAQAAAIEGGTAALLRLSYQLREHDAVLLLPALVGAWGTRP